MTRVLSALLLRVWHAAHSSILLSIVLLVSIVVMAYYSQDSPRTSGTAPPRIRGLPFIGSALDLLTPHTFLLRHQARLGDIFSFHLFGTRVHIVLDPMAAMSVFKSRELSFREIEKWIDNDFFAYPDSMTNSPDDREFLAMEKSVKPHLVTTTGIAAMSDAYLATLVPLLLDDLAGVREAGEEGLVVEDLWQWVRERAYRASTTAFFGPHWPVEATKDLYWQYEAALTEFLLFPKLLLRRKRRIRERLVAIIADAIEATGLEGCSGLMRDRLLLGREFGYSFHDRAKICIDVLFALQANATPMTFWLLAHIVHAPRLHDRVVAMTRTMPAPRQDAAPAEWDEIKRLVNDAWITSLFDESLRLHAHASIMRKCTEETRVGSFSVCAGEFVVIPTPTFQHSPRIWRRPFDFDESRFARLAEGEEGVYGPLKKEEVLIPFGGKWGLHYCPGRFFAKLEIVALSLLMCKIFEIETLNGLPEGWINGKYGNGAQQPVDKMRVRLRVA